MCRKFDPCRGTNNTKGIIRPTNLLPFKLINVVNPGPQTKGMQLSLWSCLVGIAVGIKKGVTTILVITP